MTEAMKQFMDTSVPLPTGENGKPSLEECAAAFSRIVDILAPVIEGNVFMPAGDDPVEQASDIAAGFWRDIRVNLEREKMAAEEAAKLKPCPVAGCGNETPGGTLCPLCDLLER